jgi:hypothetical protein
MGDYVETSYPTKVGYSLTKNLIDKSIIVFRHRKVHQKKWLLH